MQRCLNTHRCIPLPFPMNDTCKPAQSAAPFNMSTLSRHSWWAVYGHNPTADCGNCQRRHIHPDRNDSAWRYDYTIVTTAANGTWFNFTYPNALHPSAEQLHSMSSWKWGWGDEFGLPFKEHWWLLNDGGDWLSIYYCVTIPSRGEALQLEGGLVLSSTPLLPAGALQSANVSFARMGVDLSSFCKVDNGAGCRPSL